MIRWNEADTARNRDGDVVHRSDIEFLTNGGHTRRCAESIMFGAGKCVCGVTVKTQAQKGEKTMENTLPENFSVSDCETAFFNRCPNIGGVCQEVCENCPDFRLRNLECGCGECRECLVFDLEHNWAPGSRRGGWLKTDHVDSRDGVRRLWVDVETGKTDLSFNLVDRELGLIC